ncbi:MAG TPA: SDR family NAD(P)-dependent oxidoreductase, partial [Rubellimicrobium sp.]|nr:SDR family NAD(P)-dependent oxidoreductase [Rubellimicrobium sp.]
MGLIPAGQTHGRSFVAGQRVLITAGASGLGRAMAEAFADDGAQVCVADTDVAALNGCPTDWRRVELDVTDEAGMGMLVNGLVQDWGGIDVLCANAGIAGPTARIEDQPTDGFRRC